MSLIAQTDLAGRPSLHHIGFVVSDISAIAERFARTVDSTWNGSVIHDPIQKVHVSFLVPAVETAPMIELVAPASDASPVTAFLQRGGGLHHVAYEVESLQDALRNARRNGQVLVGKAQPAVAFGNRLIAWTYTRDRLLIEYIER